MIEQNNDIFNLNKNNLKEIRLKIKRKHYYTKREQGYFTRDNLQTFFKLYDDFYLRNYTVLKTEYNFELGMYCYLIEYDKYYYPKIIEYLNKLINNEKFDLDLIYNYEEYSTFLKDNIKTKYIDDILKNINKK